MVILLFGHKLAPLGHWTFLFPCKSLSCTHFKHFDSAQPRPTQAVSTSNSIPKTSWRPWGLLGTPWGPPEQLNWGVSQRARGRVWGMSWSLCPWTIFDDFEKCETKENGCPWAPLSTLGDPWAPVGYLFCTFWDPFLGEGGMLTETIEYVIVRIRHGTSYANRTLNVAIC